MFSFDSESQEFLPLSGDANTTWSPNTLRPGEGSGSSQTLVFWQVLIFFIHVSRISSIRILIFFSLFFFLIRWQESQSFIPRAKKRCKYRDTFCRRLVSTIQLLSNWIFGSANGRTVVFVNYQTFTQQSTNNWIDLRHWHILFTTHVSSYLSRLC